jgi:hypothetical protein
VEAWTALMNKGLITVLYSGRTPAKTEGAGGLGENARPHDDPAQARTGPTRVEKFRWPCGRDRTGAGAIENGGRGQWLF